MRAHRLPGVEGPPNAAVDGSRGEGSEDLGRRGNLGWARKREGRVPSRTNAMTILVKAQERGAGAPKS